MSIGEKRTSQHTDLEAIQRGNESWWTAHPMAYSWKRKIEHEQFSLAWFDHIDDLFRFGSRLFAHDRTPFDRIIPFDRLKGKRVLEIGCGMGYHSELLSRCGAELTAVDIAETSIVATQKRLRLKGLEATVEKMDARKLAFADNHFDFVWSWGVIHHSAETARIIAEIHRVLRPDGETRLMVYNLNGATAYMFLVRRYLLGFWRGLELDECLWRQTDGFMARYYLRDQLLDFMRVFFTEVNATTFGQDVDAVPLPRRLRQLVLKLMRPQRVAELANRRGGFLFITARK